MQKDKVNANSKPKRSVTIIMDPKEFDMTHSNLQNVLNKSRETFRKLYGEEAYKELLKNQGG